MTCLLIFNAVIPLIILLGGVMMRNLSNGKINHIAGYRTTMSMKNKDTWQFAHKECGKLWIKYGAILTAGCVVIAVLSVILGIEFATVVCLAYMTFCVVVILYSVYKVESKLKSTFDKNGNRKEA